MTAEQRKTIFGLSKGLNMNNDELHIMVSGLTGRESLKELTDPQTEDVIRELRYRMRYSDNTKPVKKTAPKEKPEAVPGMMTAEQQSLAWRLMYRLQELDKKPRFHENGQSVTVGERMAGAVNKILGITTAPGENIFRWVSFDEGSRLIEGLKRYVRSAERKANKEGRTNGQ